MTDPNRCQVSLTGLYIEQPNGQVLLRDASLQLRPGETVLLVGPTGCGKSTLLRVLAGLLGNGEAGWKIAGRLRLGTREVDLAHARYTAGALVFQDHALFDDLTVGENLQIALSHADTRCPTTERLAEALARDLDPESTASACSGGQKQILAVARTLLTNPSLLLFDEPNSGLDPGNTVRLAMVLEKVREQAQRPLLITAHHIQHLLPVATRVVYLDTRSKSLIDIDPDPHLIDDRLRQSTTGADRARPARSRQQAATSPVTPITQPRSKPSWAARYFTSYAWQLCFSPESLLYMGLGAILVGFVSTWFTFRHFPFSDHLAPLFQEELLTAIGFAQFRILVPLIAAILLAARCSTIIAADQGHRVYSKQIDAMRNLAIPHDLYLTASIVVATLTAALVLSIFMFAISAWASLATWSYLFPDGSRHFWRANFFAAITGGEPTTPVGAGWVLGKMIVSAVGIALIGTLFGRTAKASVADLNQGVALALVVSVAFVLLVHSVGALLEF